MNLPLSGGCLCGAVRYEITAAPVKALNCHCRTCQKALGAPYMAMLLVPSAALHFDGAYIEFATRAASGNTVWRGFCPKCGTTLCGRFSGMNSLRAVAAVTLDEPEVFKPEADMWTADAQPWDIMHPDLPKLAGGPARSPSSLRGRL